MMAAMLPLLIEHRAMYRDELSVVHDLSTEHPPVLFDYARAEWQEAEAAMVGLNLTAQLVRLLGHPEGFGQLFPWRAALWRLRHECRGSHLGHVERPEFSGSLCHRLTSLTVAQDYSPDMAALALGLDPRRALRVLESALRWIEDSIDRERARQEARQAMLDHQAAEILAIRFARDHDQPREERAWEWLRRHGYAALPSWEIEAARRAAEHELFGCRNCPLAQGAYSAASDSRTVRDGQRDPRPEQVLVPPLS